MKKFTKKIVPAVLIVTGFLVIASFGGCKVKETQTPEIKNFQKSECLNETQDVPVLQENVPFNEEITFVSQNSLLHVELSKMMACCLEKIDYEISIVEKTIIIINLKQTPLIPECNCVCPFILNFDIANLAFGSYVVKIQFDGEQQGNDINLIYDSNTNQTNQL